MKTLIRFFCILLAIELILVGFYCGFQSLCDSSIQSKFLNFCRNNEQRTIETLAIIPIYVGILVLLYSKPLIKYLKLK